MNVGKKDTGKIGILVRVTPEQLDMIHERMRVIPTDNREAYMRKMAIDGYILNMDDTALREMSRYLRSISNNFNQVAKMANSTGHVYDADLLDMAQKLNSIWDMQKQFMDKLSQIK